MNSKRVLFMAILVLMGLVALQSNFCLAGPNPSQNPGMYGFKPLDDIHSMSWLAYELTKNRAGDFFCLVQYEKGKPSVALLTYKEGTGLEAMKQDFLNALDLILNRKYVGEETARAEKISTMKNWAWGEIQSSWKQNTRVAFDFPEYKGGLVIDMRPALQKLFISGSIFIK